MLETKKNTICAFDCDNTIFPNLTEILIPCYKNNNRLTNDEIFILIKDIIENIAKMSGKIFIKKNNPIGQKFLISLIYSKGEVSIFFNTVAFTNFPEAGKLAMETFIKEIFKDEKMRKALGNRNLNIYYLYRCGKDYFNIKKKTFNIKNNTFKDDYTPILPKNIFLRNQNYKINALQELDEYLKSKNIKIEKYHFFDNDTSYFADKQNPTKKDKEFKKKIQTHPVFVTFDKRVIKKFTDYPYQDQSKPSNPEFTFNLDMKEFNEFLISIIQENGKIRQESRPIIKNQAIVNFARQNHLHRKTKKMNKNPFVNFLKECIPSISSK